MFYDPDDYLFLLFSLAHSSPFYPDHFLCILYYRNIDFWAQKSHLLITSFADVDIEYKGKKQWAWDHTVGVYIKTFLPFAWISRLNLYYIFSIYSVKTSGSPNVSEVFFLTLHAPCLSSDYHITIILSSLQYLPILFLIISLLYVEGHISGAMPLLLLLKSFRFIPKSISKFI